MIRVAVIAVMLLQAVTVLAADKPDAPPAMPEKVEVTGIKAAHRHGQTFVTFKDAAEGAAGALFRYSLYRSDKPITQDNLDKAQLCYTGVFNNSAKMIGAAYTTTPAGGPSFGTSRLNPETPVVTLMRDGKPVSTPMPTMTLDAGGTPLPMWSGVAVHTATANGNAYYAVVATDTTCTKLLSKVVPGQSATTEAIEETVAPIQPIKVLDSKTYGRYAAQLSITGTKNLPLQIRLHASNAAGGLAGDHGDYYIYFGTQEMGYRDGLPGAFCITEVRPAGGTGFKNGTLVLAPRDTIESSNGLGAIETYWFGYYCTPQWATDKQPRAYPFTENRVLWIIDWVSRTYDVDRTRVYGEGQSMGGWGSTSLLFRQENLITGVWPRLPRTRQRGLPALPGGTKIEDVLMPDGKTRYLDRMDAVKFVGEHHEDLPFYAWSIGRHDGFATWKEQVEMVRSLTAARHGFAFAWNDGGHSEGSRPMDEVKKYYPMDKFATNLSYPAFGNSSIDGNLGGGDLADGKQIKDGDPAGSINLGFIWTMQADEPDRWSVTLSNDRCKDAPMTVDVTPRRCQKFKLKAGDKLNWTNSAGGSGQATVDQWGLVTIEKVAIKPGESITLTISR